jgi:RNA polymerase sigma factor (sigma-70 family)
MEKEFVEMINTNRAIIYKVCNLYCHIDEDKKDLFQEIVLQLWKAYPNFRKESLNTSWMYKVALNTAISNFRKESKNPARKSISVAEFEIPDMNFNEEDNEKPYLLKQAIEKLSEIEKAIIMLYLEDKSYDEIAEIVGISNSNVGVRLNRIKSKLEKIIKSNQL